MDKLPSKPRRVIKSTREELMNLEKDKLVARILQLEAHNIQLRNIINKSQSGNPKSEYKNMKTFDFAKCHTRRILLHILYFGWDYQGLVAQEDSTQTVEHHLFQALTKTCLIESRETSEYHRCGRTDKGVSAFGQVISITVRSKHAPEYQKNSTSLTTEIQYCKILNRLLPKEIRAVAWLPIPEDLPRYSARFDCKKRQYKYYFPRSDLDISAMREACKELIGSHDFRNLCKMDVGNGVTQFIRNIITADIVDIDKTDSPKSMLCLVIEGNAFLWHQIRCIMGVLLLIGQGRESSDVIKHLLDVERTPRKPQYDMALDIPLNLFHCTYDVEDTSAWVYDKEELKCIVKHLQGEWTVHNVKATMISDTLKQLEARYTKLCESETEDKTSASEEDRLMFYEDCLIQGVNPRNYTPLLKRKTCSSLEEKVEYYRKRRK